MTKRKKLRMGRPPKADKFDAQISFQCHKSLKDAVDRFRAEHGLKSEGEAIRGMIQAVLKLSKAK